MGCCCSLPPDIHYCKECDTNVMESYPHTKCPKCQKCLYTTEKQPKPFALPGSDEHRRRKILLPLILFM